MSQKTFKVVRWVNHDNKDYFPGDSLIATPEAVQEAVKVGAIYEDPNAAPPLIIAPQVTPIAAVPPVVVADEVVTPSSEVTSVVTTTPATVTTKKDK